MPPRHREPGGEPPGSGSKVVVGYDYIDTGTRPLPSGSVFWASPFIAVSTADPVIGAIPADEPATLSVQIQNLSVVGAALGTTASFFFAVPSAGALTNITKIGDSDQLSLPAGAADLFECTTQWTPSLAAGGAHQCLLVQASALNDSVTSPWRPDLDRHVAQKNLTIVDRAEQQLTVTISNPFSFDALVTIAVRSWRVRGITAELAERLRTTQWDLSAHAGTSAVKELLAGSDVEVQDIDPDGLSFESISDESSFDTFDEDTERQLRERRGEGLGGPVLAESGMSTGSQRDVSIVAGMPPAGDWITVHHLVQRIDDVEIGGYTVVAGLTG